MAGRLEHTITIFFTFPPNPEVQEYTYREATDDVVAPARPNRASISLETLQANLKDTTDLFIRQVNLISTKAHRDIAVARKYELVVTPTGAELRLEIGTIDLVLTYITGTNQAQALPRDAIHMSWAEFVTFFDAVVQFAAVARRLRDG